MLRHDPPDWNRLVNDHQLCTCEHEKSVHGNGEFWTSCQMAGCECSRFAVATQSPEAKAKFREEMDAGLRCKQCGSGFHEAEYHDRPIYGGPVCNYPDCGHEPSFWDVLRRDLRRLVKRG